MGSPIEALAAFVAEVSLDDVPDERVTTYKMQLLDALTCAIVRATFRMAASLRAPPTSWVAATRRR
jgi:2-methylcitrate dehydratase PrpD